MNRFEQVECIGTGAYSTVFKGIDRISRETVAIKQISHQNIGMNQILNRQVRILRKLNHPNIIKLIDCFAEANSTFLIFEYIPYDLITFYKKIHTQHRRNLNDQQISSIFYQLCQALAYLHSLNLMHRDIKPENILIDPNTLQVKIIDFGFATENKNHHINTKYMVTRWYRSLQIVLDLPYDFKADIFALGAMILQLYLGEEVFKSSSNIDQLYWICQVCGAPSWYPIQEKIKQLGVYIKPQSPPKIYSLTKNLRPEASNILIGMLQPNPCQRMSAFQALRHPYFSKYQLTWQRNRRMQSMGDFSRTPLRNQFLEMPSSHKKKVNVLTHVNSQPFLTHARTLSERDPEHIKQFSLVKQKANIGEIEQVKAHHARTDTGDGNILKIPTSIEKTPQELPEKKRTKSLNPGLKLISLKKDQNGLSEANLRPKLLTNKNINKIQKTNQPPVFSKIKDKLIEINRSNYKYKNNKISLTDRTEPQRKILKFIK